MSVRDDAGSDGFSPLLYDNPSEVEMDHPTLEQLEQDTVDLPAASHAMQRMAGKLFLMHNYGTFAHGNN